jgi:hypothetical protein
VHQPRAFIARDELSGYDTKCAIAVDCDGVEQLLVPPADQLAARVFGNDGVFP